MNMLQSRGLEMVMAEEAFKHLKHQNISIHEWWIQPQFNTTPITNERPKLAYELFIDAQRLSIDDTYVSDGDAVGSYAAAAMEEPMKALEYMADFVRTAKYLKLMPSWWNPQHDIAMFRIALDKKDDFCLYHAQELKDIRKQWGYETTQILRLLGRTVVESMRHKIDEITVCFGELAMNNRPRREVGHGAGLGKECRYGAECKRRDCWYKHPRLTCNPIDHLIIASQDRRDDEFSRYSNKSLTDHMIEIAGGKENTMDILYCYVILVHSSTPNGGFDKILLDKNRKVIPPWGAQIWLEEKVKEGNAMAEYAVGKLLGDKVYDASFFAKGSRQYDKMLKLWTSSALKGNGLAMAGLAQEHRDLGCQATANTWWEKALTVVELPEAAYNLGVSYALQEYPEAGVPIQYKRAVKYYAYAIDMDMPNVDAALKSPFSESKYLIPPSFTELLLSFGPQNEHQRKDFQKFAGSNLRIVEKYLAYPETAPFSSSPSPDISNIDKKCALCSRQPRIGEKVLVRCSRCHTTYYCNSICQKGDWPRHKSECKRCVNTS